MSGVQTSYTFGNDVFHLKSRLGAGAFGAVFLALMNDKPGEEVAVKRIVFNQTNDSGIKNVLSQQLQDKWKKALSLDHPNLVRYLHAQIYDNQQVANQKEGLIVLEYCNGGSLDNYLKKQREYNVETPMSLSAVKTCTKDILEGLNYLHNDMYKIKIAHTDLKPANILLTQQNGQISAKIADIDDHVAIIATVTRSEVKNTVGTTQYQSWEILQANYNLDKVGRRTDIWSLGCIVIEISRGSLPFKLIKMDGERPVPTDFLLVDPAVPGVVVRDFIVQNGVPEIPRNEILQGFAGLERCFKRKVLERPKAEDLLQDPWLTGGPWFWPAKK